MLAYSSLSMNILPLYSFWLLWKELSFHILTLVLKDVPWNFRLHYIMSIDDLEQKRISVPKKNLVSKYFNPFPS